MLAAKPGQKVRLRVINATSDTIFAVALGGHRLTITHSDGHAVEPTEVGAFYIGMGERFDAIVTLADGAFPLVARPFGKTSGGQAMAVVVPAPALLLRLPLTRASWLVRSSSAHSCARPKPPSCRARSRTPPSTWPCKAR